MLALLTLLPTLLPTLAPALGRFLAGNSGEAAGKAVSDAVMAVTGTTDEAGLRAALADPDKAGALLLRINTLAAEREAAERQAALDTLKAGLADVASARALSASTPLIAKTQVWLAVGILALFAATLALLVTRGVPYGQETLLNVLLGALTMGLAQVMQFFFGNSTSGHSANNALAAMAGGSTPATRLPPASPPPAPRVAPAPSPPGTTADDLNARELQRVRP